MEDFNIFKPLLEKSIKVWEYHILAKEGSIYNFMSKHTYSGGKKVVFTSIKDRTRESDRVTECKLLIYDPVSSSLDSKCTYRNNKGVYFKKDGKVHYI